MARARALLSLMQGTRFVYIRIFDIPIGLREVTYSSKTRYFLRCLFITLVLLITYEYTVKFKMIFTRKKFRRKIY